MSEFIDLTGKKFNKLTVIKRAEDRVLPCGQRKTMWECRCDCGNEKIIYVNSYDLRHNKIKSCGCLKHKAYYIKTNKYDLTGEYGIGWTTNTNKEFYFDLEDYDLIKNYCWYESHGYIKTATPVNSIEKYGKYIFMHKLILGTILNYEYDIDHIEGNRNDNRKEKLRLCTRSQNQMNKGIRSDNTSKYIGVNYRKDRKKWRAYITVNNKQISLGNYDDIEDAIVARRNAEDKYFGRYSYSNSRKNNK